MRYAHKIKITFRIVTLACTLFKVSIAGGEPLTRKEEALPDTSLAGGEPLTRKEEALPDISLIEKDEAVAETVLHEGKIDKKEQSEDTKATLPLSKVAHKTSMELLHLFFTPQHLDVPIYTPLIHHLGIKIKWWGLVRGIYSGMNHQTYEGGIDLNFRKNIQLSVEMGYEKERFALNGKYGAISLLYVGHPFDSTNAYIGIAYGGSRFNLTSASGENLVGPYRPSTAGWIKLVFGSEYNLTTRTGLYGGVQFGVSHLLYDSNRKGGKNSGVVYIVPGYGKVNKPTVSFEIIPYLKWNISFLQKKISIK